MSNELVRRGYDRAAARYLAARDRFASHQQLALLTSRLPAGARILDVGCGAGAPIDQALVEQGYRVSGIDISPEQIRLARARVPQATYAVQDLSTLQTGQYQVDAVVSFYALFHTRRETHQRTTATFGSFLPPGGLVLVTMGSSDWEGSEEDFYGVRMYWSHYDAPRNHKLIEAAGFTVLHDAIDDQAGERHQIVLAQKPTV